MSLDGVFRLSVEGLWQSVSQTVNVLNYRPTVANISPTAENLANDFIDNVLPSYLAVISNVNFIQRVVVVPAVGIEAGFEVGVNLNGDLTGDSTPSQICPLVSWKTGKRGRSFRGRTYLPPSNEAVISGNFTVAYLGLLDDFGDAAMSISVAAIPVWQLVIVSTTLDEANDVVSHTSPVYPATQRRRRPGSGS